MRRNLILGLGVYFPLVAFPAVWMADAKTSGTYSDSGLSVAYLLAVLIWAAMAILYTPALFKLSNVSSTSSSVARLAGIAGTALVGASFAGMGWPAVVNILIAVSSAVVALTIATA